VTDRVGVCGHELTGRRLKYCSDECQREAARAVLLAQRFNITPAEYDAILAEQGGRCPVCLKRPAQGKRYPVDHDHKSGFSRGILCLSCNLTFIGRQRDPEKFRRAAEYLENPPAERVIGQRIAPGRPRARRSTRTQASPFGRRRRRKATT
jgi:Recombination endonuclease VII.